LYNEGFIEDFETDVTIISLIALSILFQKIRTGNPKTNFIKSLTIFSHGETKLYALLYIPWTYFYFLHQNNLLVLAK